MRKETNPNPTPLQRIRLYCLGCSNDSPKEVKLCTHTECKLYPLRSGHNPKRLGIAPNQGSILKKSLIELNKTTKEGDLNDSDKHSRNAESL